MYFKQLEQPLEKVKADKILGSLDPRKEKSGAKYLQFVSFNMVESMNPREEEGLTRDVNVILLVALASHSYKDECKPRFFSI